MPASANSPVFRKPREGVTQGGTKVLTRIAGRRPTRSDHPPQTGERRTASPSSSPSAPQWSAPRLRNSPIRREQRGTMPNPIKSTKTVRKMIPMEGDAMRDEVWGPPRSGQFKAESPEADFASWENPGSLSDSPLQSGECYGVIPQRQRLRGSGVRQGGLGGKDIQLGSATSIIACHGGERLFRLFNDLGLGFEDLLCLDKIGIGGPNLGLNLSGGVIDNDVRSLQTGLRRLDPTPGGP